MARREEWQSACYANHIAADTQQESPPQHFVTHVERRQGYWELLGV
jgi:hypothetical protein